MGRIRIQLFPKSIYEEDNTFLKSSKLFLGKLPVVKKMCYLDLRASNSVVLVIFNIPPFLKKGTAVLHL